MARTQLFIIGTGRSGTTILRDILGHHPKIYAYPSELRFMTDANGLMDMADDLTVNWNPFNASRSVKEFEKLISKYIWSEPLYHRYMSAFFDIVLKGSGRKYRYSNLGNIIPKSHLRSTLKALINEITIRRVPGYWLGTESYNPFPKLYITRRFEEKELYPILGRFVDDLLSYPLKNTSKEVWCDDTPINIMKAHRIAKMLESARIIHLYRDPRDVVASYADPRQAWAPNNPELSAIWVREIIKNWFQVRELIPNHQYIEIKYEDMVKNQKKYVGRILDFVKCDYDKRVETISLTDSSVGRYKDEMSKEEISKVNSIVAPILDEYYN